MKWRDREGSSNIEDRRSTRGKKLTISGIILTAAITYFMSGGDIGAVLNAVLSESMSQAPSTKEYHPSPKEQEYAKFVSVVLKDTEDVWSDVFERNGMRYKKPTLVLFKGYTSSACGNANSATGPFYCPVDQKVYIDLGFFDELHNKFHAQGDFAQAYVVPDSFTHGSAQQRKKWFYTGYQSGNINACNTFKVVR